MPAAFSLSLRSLSEGGRRHTEYAFEIDIKTHGAGKTGFRCDVRNAEIRVQKQILCVHQSFVDQIIVRRHAECLLEQGIQLSSRIAELVAERVDIKGQEFFAL